MGILTNDRPSGYPQADETNETFDDISRKNSLAITTITSVGANGKKRSSKMTTPSFRFLIIPLGAICTLASLSARTPHPARSAT